MQNARYARQAKAMTIPMKVHSPACQGAGKILEDKSQPSTCTCEGHTMFQCNPTRHDIDFGKYSGAVH